MRTVWPGAGAGVVVPIGQDVIRAGGHVVVAPAEGGRALARGDDALVLAVLQHLVVDVLPTRRGRPRRGRDRAARRRGRFPAGSGRRSAAPACSAPRTGRTPRPCRRGRRAPRAPGTAGARPGGRGCAGPRPAGLPGSKRMRRLGLWPVKQAMDSTRPSPLSPAPSRIPIQYSIFGSRFEGPAAKGRAKKIRPGWGRIFWGSAHQSLTMCTSIWL